MCKYIGYAFVCACFVFGLAAMPAGVALPASAHSPTTAQQTQAPISLVYGPADIPMRSEAVLHLPAGDVFIPEAQARVLMEQEGNTPDSGFIGVIMADGNGDRGWIVVADYDDSGFVKDEDSGQIDADKILASMKEGAAHDNIRRAGTNVPEIEVVGWVEKPRYDKARHQLVWAVEVREKAKAGQPAQAAQDHGINYNTFSLGRHGYISLNLLTRSKDLEQNKPHVAALLSALDFDKGKAYTDFNASTDKVATFGLLALIGGLAVKKIGLFALAAGFAAKFAKVLVLAAAAVVAAIKKFFMSGRRDETRPPQNPQA